ncbi:MAG: thiamine phosphate synthase [Ancrocorticia sp.]
MTTAVSGIADAVDWRLYFVTDTDLSGGPERVPWTVEQAILGGCGVVQIRDKSLPDSEFLALTQACVEAAERAYDQSGRRAALVVNDRLDVAEELGLHFHQGQSDGDVRESRRRLGNDLLIGLSISDADQLEAELAEATADVVGIGPIWPTPTKTDTDPALGPNGAGFLVRKATGHVHTVAIGGINATNARSVIDVGFDGICVVSAIATAPDPREAATRLLSLW